MPVTIYVVLYWMCVVPVKLSICIYIWPNGANYSGKTQCKGTFAVLMIGLWNIWGKSLQSLLTNDQIIRLRKWRGSIKYFKELYIKMSIPQAYPIDSMYFTFSKNAYKKLSENLDQA